jgi:hypothetical protein
LLSPFLKGAFARRRAFWILGGMAAVAAAGLSVIENYQADIKTLQGTEFSQRKAFEDFLAGFRAE